MRETVVLAVGNLYLMALADRARLDAADAQVTTAETLAQLAEDQLSSGLVPQIDVLRQQVQLQAARSRQIAASNSLAKRKLQLARAIGLPARQAFELSDSAAYKPMAAPTIDEAVAEASAHRPDVAGARARLEAARAARRAAASGALPTLDVDADVGALGPSASTAERTFTVAATVRMPIFEGGRTRANVREADARMKEREAELADLQGGLRYDISAALLDLQAAATAVDVASSARTLADQELTQAQDRFQAGVASSVELVQAQESVARASEQYIDAVYGHMLAKAGLAQAMGELEQRFLTLVGGQP